MSEKAVIMSQEEYYKLLKHITFMSEPFDVKDHDAFARVQHSALAVRCEFIGIGDRNLLPRSEPTGERRSGEDRRREEKERDDRERQDRFDREQLREYEKQVREEDG